MRQYFKFIFLLVQLLFVQSEDLNFKCFYRKLLETTNRSKFLSNSSSLSTKVRLPVMYSYTSYEQLYSRIQTATAAIDLYFVRTFNNRDIYEAKQFWNAQISYERKRRCVINSRGISFLFRS